jgi:hypothetical protein
MTMKADVTLDGSDDIQALRLTDSEPVGDQYLIRNHNGLIVWASVSELREMSEKLNDLANEIMMRKLQPEPEPVAICAPGEFGHSESHVS